MSHMTKSYTLLNNYIIEAISLLGITHEGDTKNFLRARLGSASLQGEVLSKNPWLEKFWTPNSPLFVGQQLPYNLTVSLPLVLVQ